MFRTIFGKLSKLYLKQHGVARVAGKTMEECGELIQLLNKAFIFPHRRKPLTDRQRIKIAGEMADVMIMLEVLTDIIGEDVVEAQYLAKATRFKRRLDKANLGDIKHGHNSERRRARRQIVPPTIQKGKTEFSSEVHASLQRPVDVERPRGLAQYGRSSADNT